MFVGGLFDVEGSHDVFVVVESVVGSRQVASAFATVDATELIEINVLT